jgi:hydrogenase maturation protease
VKVTVHGDGNGEHSPAAAASVSRAPIDQVIEAVLYEGYILYPYRASSKKNRQRFTFGRVYPYDYHIAQKGAEAWTMQSQVLMRRIEPEAGFDVSVRFLQPITREIGKLKTPLAELPEGTEPEMQMVPELEVDGVLHQAWQECIERQIELPDQDFAGNVRNVPFSFPAARTLESLRNKDNQISAVFVRRQEAIEGHIEIATERVDEAVAKIFVRLNNSTPIPGQAIDREVDVLLRTLASAHTIFYARGGEFISLTDPPAEYAAAAASCQNVGCWPVLIGDEARSERGVMLASPIILPDYPQIAPESAGTLYDGLEIDEILTLRIMTMTDEEKREMRGVDQHARALLERTESLNGGHLMKLHGTMRGLHPVEPGAPEHDLFDSRIFGNSHKIEGAKVKGAFLRAGDSVRIRPRNRADAMDMILAGKTALIEAVEEDAEGKVHFALVIEDDPGREFGMMRQPGHRFFYGADEVEPLTEKASA